jgi:hypothetical protein
VIERAHADDRLQGAVVEHPLDGSLLAIGISGFVRGAPIDQANRAARPLVPDLLTAEATGVPILLGPEAMADAAREDDLHLVIVLYRQHSFDPQSADAQEVLRAGHAAYRLIHGGYRLRSVWQEGEAADAAWMQAGGLLLKRTYPADSGLGRILCGTLREDLTNDWPGNTVSFLFNDQVPRLQLTPMQRRVAHLTLWNLSDDQVARRLAISPATVRQHWRGIVQRVHESLPGVIGMPMQGASDASGGRGPEKRGLVLDYLRVNLQEVRPRR